MIEDIDEAIDQALEAKKKERHYPLECNAMRCILLERLLERNIIPDTLTDQTSAHDPLIGYWPHEISYEASKNLKRIKILQNISSYAYESMYRHVELMLELQNKGAVTFDYGNNIRARACRKRIAKCI